MNSVTESKGEKSSVSTISRKKKNTDRSVHWLGSVNYEALTKTSSKIKEMYEIDHKAEITLFVSSPGGASGIAMSFYDTMTKFLKPKLQTIGSGDVDSSGIIIFLSGEKRILTENTTMLLHLAGRTFDPAKRYTTVDLEAIIREDRLKDYQYACIVADRSNGRLTPDKVLEMMSRNTVLTPTEAVNFGIAHEVLAH